MTRYYHSTASSSSFYSSSEGSYTSSSYYSSSDYYSSTDASSYGSYTSSSGYSSTSYYSSIGSSETEQSSRQQSPVYTPWSSGNTASGPSSWFRASTPPPRSLSFSGYSGQSSSIQSQPDTPARSVSTPTERSYTPYINKTPVRRWSISDSSIGLYSRSESGTPSMSSTASSISSAVPSMSSDPKSGINKANNIQRYFRSNHTPVSSSGVSRTSSLDNGSKTSDTQSNVLSRQNSTESSASTNVNRSSSMYSSYSRNDPSKSSFSSSAISRDSPVGWKQWLKNDKQKQSATESQTEWTISKAVPKKVNFARELESKSDSSYIDWNKKQDRKKYIDDLKYRESTATSQEEVDLIRQHRQEMEGFSSDTASIENDYTTFLSDAASINDELEGMELNLLSMRDRIAAL